MLKRVAVVSILCASMLVSGCASIAPLPELQAFTKVSQAKCKRPAVWKIEKESDKKSGKKITTAVCRASGMGYYGPMTQSPVSHELMTLPSFREISISHIGCEYPATWEVRLDPENPKLPIAVCGVPDNYYASSGWWTYGPMWLPMMPMWGTIYR